MKQKFSTAWKASKQPRKHRKYEAEAPLHLKLKLLGANLSKDLRKKYGKRSISVRKGDTVKVMKGKFRKKQGKINEINLKLQKIYVDGCQVKKLDGSKVNVPLKASNLQIIELNLEDKKRAKKLGVKTDTKKTEDKKESKKPEKKEVKKEVKKENNKGDKK